MSQAGSNGGGGSGSSGVLTITGNTGGPISPTAGNINIVTAGTTAVFAGTGSTETLNFAISNLLVGGDGMLTSGEGNSGFGFLALEDIESGDFNTAVGGSALQILPDGSWNTCIGYHSGLTYVSNESSNIIIGDGDVVGDNNTIRIGNQGSSLGFQNKAFIAGIVGVTSSNPEFVTIDSTTGQLGVTAVVTQGIVSIDGDSGSATGTSVSLLGSNNGGGSVFFIANTNEVELFTTDSNGNTMIGQGCGVANTSATHTTALGLNTLNAIGSGDGNSVIGSGSAPLLDSGTGNSIVGYNCMTLANANETGNSVLGYLALNGGLGCARNIAIGVGPMQAASGAKDNIVMGTSTANNLINDGMGDAHEGCDNIIIGNGSFDSATTSEFNVSIGGNIASSMLTGNYNILLGSGNNSSINVGDSYVSSESSNIILQNSGVVGDNNTIRIGTQGSGDAQQDTCFIAGIASVSTSNSEFVTIDTTTGQLGSTSSSAFTLTARVQLTSAQVKSINATPITLIPAQGVGTVIRVISVFANLNYGGTNAFTNPSNTNLALYYTNNTGLEVETNILEDLGVVATQDVGQYAPIAASAGSLPTGTIENTPVVITTDNGVSEFGGNAANNNTITVTAVYMTVTL